ncbi:MAG: DNA polymerase III subunit gamma/tau [Candidatus Kapaibacterium sp.]
MEKNSKDQTSFIVTARKWRPLQFTDVIGQDHITRTLKNAIEANRVHHAYLFSGPRGVGKTTAARIYARAVNCLNSQDAEPCNKCESCVPILEGRSMDVIEIDGASNNSVDDIRKLRENSRYPPVNGRYKMYIIDEVHMLSSSAFNALLKTLEEPPPHLMFVFATTESHKVPATIISRCQKFDFRRMEIKEITGRLSYIAENENIEIDDASLIAIAKKADGSMRDSQSIFDQVVAFCGKNISYSDMSGALNLIDEDFFFEISDAINSNDKSKMFSLAAQVISRGYDINECVHGLLEHMRNLISVKVAGNSSLIETSENFAKRYESTADMFSERDLLRFISLISSTEQELRFSPQPKIKFELMLIRLASLDKSVQIDEILKEIASLKELAASGGSAPQASREVKTAYKASGTGTEKKTPDLNDRISIEKYPISKETPSKDNNKTNQLKNKWPQFAKAYGNGEHGLQYLNNVSAEFFAGKLILTSSDSFTMEGLKKRKAQLNEALTNFYGFPVELVLQTSDRNSIIQDSPVNKDMSQASSKPQSNRLRRTSEDLHEIEITLMDMGALEISNIDDE